MKIFGIVVLYLIVNFCESYKILGIFPYNGRSHHIYYSTLIEELAKRQHDVTVINYHPMPTLPNLRQISLQDKHNASDNINIEEHLKVLSISDFAVAYDNAKIFAFLANTNCQKLINHPEVQELISSAAQFDLVIAEQFVTDCGLAVAYKLNAPAIGMTAHILMSWTYSRLGAPNNPAYVPNAYFGSGSKPNIWSKIKSLVIDSGMNLYHSFVIQRRNQEIVNEVYPDVPLLEDLGKKMSLIMINQYFPLTGPRLYSSNVVEVGGLHVKDNVKIEDKGLQNFLENANNGVIYVSFGTVAANISPKIINEIKKVIENSKMQFVWKIDLTDWTPPSNVFVGKWMPQTAILGHPKVVAFITHSGMLSTLEAIHFGVPIVGIPMFGDQFSNAQSAIESGLGVALDVLTLNQRDLKNALNTILQEKFQKKVKELSQVWKDRPLSPMETAMFWIEYVARNKGTVNMKPATVDTSFYQYFLLDVIFVIGTVFFLLLFIVFKFVSLLVKQTPKTTSKNVKKVKRKKNE